MKALDSIVLFKRNILKQSSKRGCKEYKVITVCGYGMIKVGTKHIYAHRFAYELYHGKIPKGMYVMHSCDNKRCVRKEHLSLGTLADNNHDRDRKGRFNVLHGSKNGKAILNEAKVKRIKRLIKEGVSNIKIGLEYGVHHSTISKIKTDVHWRRV